MVITVKEALVLASQMLSPFSDEPKSEAKYIVSYLSDTPLNMLAFSSASVDRDKLEEIVKKRRSGLPLQYILGKWWFYKSEFLVGEGVLVPRQDTEVLVETALELLKDKKAPRVCDLCSGSGCIAISIALERKDAEVTAVEKYDEAYAYLVKNTEKLGASNVTSVKADVTEEPFGRFELIVSNPPYIPDSEKAELSKEVLSEPHTALFGGEDGLYFYRIISKNWKESLSENGILAFEVGINEADAVAEILKENGYINIGTKTDLLGIQRVVFGTANNL